MDKLDVKIFRELTQDKGASPLTSDIRKSFRAIAAKLETDEDTVRVRVHKLHRTGFYQGLNLIVNPSLIGLKAARLWLDISPDSSKEEAIQKFARIPQVHSLVKCYGSSLILHLFYEQEESLERQIETFESTPHLASLHWVTVPFPDCSSNLSRTDWRIIGALQANPRRSYIKVAGELDLSSRTVKRRVEKMVRGGALFAIPSVNVRHVEGVIIVVLVFSDSPAHQGQVNGRILAGLADHVLVTELGYRDHGLFVLHVPNLWRAEEIRTWLKQQPGVKSARLGMVQDRIESYDWFRARVQQKIAYEMKILSHEAGPA